MASKFFVLLKITLQQALAKNTYIGTAATAIIMLYLC